MVWIYLQIFSVLINVPSIYPFTFLSPSNKSNEIINDVVITSTKVLSYEVPQRKFADSTFFRTVFIPTLVYKYLSRSSVSPLNVASDISLLSVDRNVSGFYGTSFCSGVLRHLIICWSITFEI